MREFRKLEEQFLTECKTYLANRADARMAEIKGFESRYLYTRASYEKTYIEMLKAKYQNAPPDDFEQFMEAQIENGAKLPSLPF
jgi:hypothetical protein